VLQIPEAYALPTPWAAGASPSATAAVGGGGNLTLEAAWRAAAGEGAVLSAAAARDAAAAAEDAMIQQAVMASLMAATVGGAGRSGGGSTRPGGGADATHGVVSDDGCTEPRDPVPAPADALPARLGVDIGPSLPASEPDAASAPRAAHVGVSSSAYPAPHAAALTVPSVSASGGTSGGGAPPSRPWSAMFRGWSGGGKAAGGAGAAGSGAHGAAASRPARTPASGGDLGDGFDGLQADMGDILTDAAREVRPAAATGMPAGVGPHPADHTPSVAVAPAPAAATGGGSAGATGGGIVFDEEDDEQLRMAIEMSLRER